MEQKLHTYKDKNTALSAMHNALRREYDEIYGQKKKKLQFSQKMTLISAVFSMVIVVGINSANFMLLWYGKQPMSQETVTAMTIYGGITSTLTFGGYCALSGIRDCSLNKTKLRTGTGGQEC